MESDARIVRARMEIVSAQLEVMRSRRGEVVSRPEEQAAIDAIGGFFDAVERDGWVASFDRAVAALKTLAARTNGGDAAEVGRMVDHLAEAERSVLRLGADAERKPQTAGSTRPYLSPSIYAPSLHALQTERTNTNAKRIVEPAELRQLERLVRDGLEEVASLSLLRSPSDEEAWSLGTGFERRLLECLDALAAYRRGPIAVDVDAAALALARGYPVVDASRWFAAAFVAACTAGDRALASLRGLALSAPPNGVRGILDALALGSSPDLDRLCLSLLGEDDRPDVLALALEACLRRTLVETPTMVELLGHPSDAVSALSARCLARAEARNTAHHLVPLLDRRGVAVAAATTLAVFRAEAGARFLREAVAGGADDRIARDAARALALLGQTRDEQTLVAVVQKGQAPLDLLADHGSPSFLPFLCNELTSASSVARSIEAASALERMTGVAMIGSAGPTEEASFDASRYASRIAANELPSAGRIRMGKNLDLSALLAELANPATRQGSRRRAALQAAIARGSLLPFDIDGWIGVQRLRIRELSATTKVAA